MPDTITLSESAVAVLRFEIKGYRARNRESRLPAYRELTAAGVMEPVPGSEGEYRFTEEGMTRREEILGAAVERLHGLEPRLPERIVLSDAARDLVRSRMEGERVEVTPENKPFYRELVAVGIMEPVSGFSTGPEATFRFTYQGWGRRHEWINGRAVAPPDGSP